MQNGVVQFFTPYNSKWIIKRLKNEICWGQQGFSAAIQREFFQFQTIKILSWRGVVTNCCITKTSFFRSSNNSNEVRQNKKKQQSYFIIEKSPRRAVELGSQVQSCARFGKIYTKFTLSHKGICPNFCSISPKQVHISQDNILSSITGLQEPLLLLRYSLEEFILSSIS